MKKITLLSLSVFFVTTLVAQQTFYGSGGPIPDLTTVQYPIYVSGLPTAINSTYGVENICIDISHTYDDDITIQIQEP
jgi:accessory colonization factor AcfC